MGKLQKLRDLFLSELVHNTPQKREYGVGWIEVTVGIGKDHVAYITMPEDALMELCDLTGNSEEPAH